MRPLVIAGAFLLLAISGFSVASELCMSCARDSRGRIKRSESTRRSFVKSHPCPSGGNGYSCKGYVVDHVVPLKRGGTDSPSNMQWQTKEAAKEKDKTE